MSGQEQCPLIPRLVDIETESVGVLVQKLLVLALQGKIHDPNRDHNHNREGHAREETHHEARRVAIGPQVRRVDTLDVAKGVAEGERHGLLLVCLTERGGDPAEHDVVDAEAEGDEQEDGDEAGGDVGCGNGKHKASDNDSFENGDVPGALIPAARSPRHDDSEDSGEEIRREGQDKRDVRAVAQCLHNRGKEGREADRGQVHVVHEGKDPSAPVRDTLHETLPSADRLLLLGGVGDDTVVGQLSLLWSEPAGLQRSVGQNEE